LIYVIVDPVGKEQVGMSTPRHQRWTVGIVVLIIVNRHLHIVALVFVALGASLFGFFSIDFSRFRSGVVKPDASRAGLAVPFFLGALSAVLAGACVAPILVSVLVLTARLYAEGNAIALALPFVLGLGMALPWPFLGAGMKVLPKPGAWMKHVNRIFAVVVLLFAAYYGYLAWKGWTRGASVAPQSNGITGAVEATPDTFEDVFAEAEEKGKPILVDCWATWCKNCFAMDRTTLADKRVREALAGYTVIRLQADDMKGFRMIEPFKDVQGLPAYAIFEITPKKETEK
jgi:thiol:disulfide interchange protein